MIPISVDGLHRNNQIRGEVQNVLWKLEECKVRFADHPPGTRTNGFSMSALP